MDLDTALYNGDEERANAVQAEVHEEVGTAVWLFPPLHQELARGTRISSASEAAAESDPCQSAESSLDGNSGPDDADAPAFGRAAVLAKSGPETGRP